MNQQSKIVRMHFFNGCIFNMQIFLFLITFLLAGCSEIQPLDTVASLPEKALQEKTLPTSASTYTSLVASNSTVVNPPANTVSFTQVRTDFATALTQSYQTASISNFYIGVYNNESYLNYGKLAKVEFQKVVKKYNAQGFDPVVFIRGFYLAPDFNTQSVVASQVPGARGNYSSGMLTVFDTYTRNMYNATSAASAQNYYYMARTAVLNSTLTNDEKLGALAFIEAGNQIAVSYYNGAYRNFGNTVGIQAGTTTVSCQVEWRQVWIGGVVGGITGGIRGGIAGATGGTVGLPGLGTVSGGLAGVVFGFTAGYVTGSLGSIARQLLSTCGRRAPLDATPVGYGTIVCVTNAYYPDCSSAVYENKLWNKPVAPITQ